MATKSRHTAITVRRHTPSVPKSKYEALVKTRHLAKKKAGEVAARRAGTLVGVGACAVVGYLEKSGKMPAVAGIEPTVVLGLAGLVLPELIKGKAGQMVAEAGAAVAGVAAYKLAAGAPLKVGEDDSLWSPA